MHIKQYGYSTWHIKQGFWVCWSDPVVNKVESVFECGSGLKNMVGSDRIELAVFIGKIDNIQ